MSKEILDTNLEGKEVTNKFTPRFGIVVFMIVAAAASRFLPHPPNFTPIGGMALFGAAYFAKKYWAFLIPFAALWLSDLILNNVVYAEFNEGFTLMPSYAIGTYLALIAMIFMGSKVLKKINIPNVIGASIGASLIFFIITNIGSWYIDPMNIYPNNIAGLGAALTAGLPFFWNTLAGDLVYVGVLFGGFEMVKNAYPQLSLNAVK